MSKRKILIAEDNALVMMSLEGLVEDMEWELIGPATSLAQAKDMAAECDADVALLDVNLNGEKSFPAAEVLAGRGIPVIFATGYGDSLDLPEPLTDAKVVNKPFRLSDLESLLRSAADA